MFRKTVDQHANRVVLSAKQNAKTYNVRYSYREMADAIRHVAATLLDMGVQAGDRTAIASNNRPEWAIFDLATFAVGAADTPLYPTLTPAQMAYILNDCGAKVLCVSNEAMLEKILEVEDQLPKLEHVICCDLTSHRPKRVKFWTWYDVVRDGQKRQSELAEPLDARLNALKADDLATIIYTSGTTGEPKGAMLTHGNLLFNTQAGLAVSDMTVDDVELSFLPLCHIFERGIFYAMLAVGARIAYAESIDTVPDNLREVEPTIVPSVPRLFEKTHARIVDRVEKQSPTAQKLFHWAMALGRKVQALKASGQPVPGLMAWQYNNVAKKVVFKGIYERLGGRIRYFISGGAPLRRDIGEFFQACDLTLLEGYGLTETSPLISINRPGRVRFGTVGNIVDGVECKIAEDGEIVCRGPNVMKGYFNKQKETAEAIDPEGWFHTGDIGKLEEGYLVITDRKKELLVLSNGKKTAPQPVENELKASPYVEQAVLLGDNRNFVAALLVPSTDAVKRWATQHGIPLPAREEWKNHEGIRRLLSEAVDKVNANLAHFEQIKQFAMLDRELTQDQDELTPTLKLKRRAVNEHFADVIDKLYAQTK
jgi:long-chain acyl-CoA synthetase